MLDVVLFDLGLFDVEGLDVFCDICVWLKVLIIVVFVCDYEWEKVMVFDFGVDDYIMKLFGILELLVWIWIVLRYI